MSDITTFLARRRPAWDELEAAVRSARGGALRGVPMAQLERLGVLYRRALSDLALARRDFPAEPVTDYLNGLVARAHPLVYRAEALRPAAIGSYVAFEVPRAFRAASGYVLASLALMLLGVVAGWLAVDLRPDLASSLAPQTSLFDRMARGEVPQGTDTGFTQALVIILNNMRVALIAFVGGVAIGLPTALILVENGWVLGTLGAVEHRDGLDVTFWSYIAPHGVIEISIFVLSGATGLMLADAILRPGLRRRSDALSAVARTAVGMAVCVACLLVTCGLVEGYLSPSAAPEGVKYAVGAVGGIGLYSWLLLAGREPRRGRRPRLSLDRPIPTGGPR